MSSFCCCIPLNCTVIVKLAPQSDEEKCCFWKQPFKIDGRLNIYSDMGGKPVANVAVVREFNLRWHYMTKYQENLKDLNAEQNKLKVQVLKENLKFSPEQNHKVKLWWKQVLLRQRREPNQPSHFPRESSEELHDEGVQGLVSRQKADVGQCKPEKYSSDQVCKVSTNLRTQLSEGQEILLWRAKSSIIKS